MQIDERRFYHSLLLLSADWRSGRAGGSAHLSWSFFFNIHARRRGKPPQTADFKGKEFYFLGDSFPRMGCVVQGSVFTRRGCTRRGGLRADLRVRGGTFKIIYKCLWAVQGQKQTKVAGDVRVSAVQASGGLYGWGGSAHRWAHQLLLNPRERRVPQPVVPAPCTGAPSPSREGESRLKDEGTSTSTLTFTASTPPERDRKARRPTSIKSFFYI